MRKKLFKMLSLLLAVSILIGIAPLGSFNLRVTAEETDHSYKSSVTLEPTCTEPGIMTYTCENCGDSYNEEIPAKGHDYIDIVTETTCKVQGSTTHKCKNCSESYVDSYIDHLGHDFVDGICANCGSKMKGDYCYSVKKELVHGSEADVAYLTGYFGSDTEVIVPETIDGYSVYGIGDGGFRDCVDVVSFTLPDRIKIVGDIAFKACSKLERIDLGHIEKIGISAFNKCESLKNVVVPDTVTVIDDYAFNGCPELESVVLPAGLESIAIYMFNNCFKLKEVTVPGSIVTVSDNAFRGCKAITDVYYTGTAEQWNSILLGINNIYLSNANLNFVEKHEHNYTTKTTDPTCVSTGLITYSCETCEDSYTDWLPLAKHNLTHIVQPATCTAPGVEMDYCSVCKNSFNTKRIPIKSHNFVNGFCSVCGKSEFWDYTVNNGNATLTGYTGNDNELVIPSIIAGYTVTAIGDLAFAGNSRLEYVSVPDTVTSIGSGAFRNCTSLKEIYIGVNARSIGSNAFAGCRSLSLVCTASGNLNFNGVFSGNDSRLVIIAPEGSASAANAAAAGLKCTTYSYPKDKDGKNAIAFNGTTTLYQNFNYYFWLELIDRYPDTYYLYFDTLTFDGIRSDSVKIDGNKISNSEYLTLNEVYLSVKNGENNITFSEMLELIGNGGADMVISFKDEQGVERNFFERIGDFFTSVFNALSKAINSIVSIFKKKK